MGDEEIHLPFFMPAIAGFILHQFDFYLSDVLLHLKIFCACEKTYPCKAMKKHTPQKKSNSQASAVRAKPLPKDHTLLLTGLALLLSLIAYLPALKAGFV